MTQEMAIGIALGVAAAVYVISLICAPKLIHLSWRVKFREKAKANGCVTTGYFEKRRKSYTIEERNGVEDYHYTVTIKYKYTVGGKDYYTKVKYTHEDQNKDPYLDDPMQVTVYYDKTNPKKGYAESKLSDSAARSEGVIWCLLATLAMGFATYFLLYALFVQKLF